MKYFIRSLIALALVAGTTSEGMAQLFRSATSGNWNAIGTWQQSTDGGASWGPASATPTNASGEITVRAPHTVTVTAPVDLDDVTVEAGGTVTTTTGGTTWVINNGTFGVRIFGTFNANAGGGSFGCCGSVSVENGGVVNMNNGGAFFGPTTVQVGGTVIGNTPINLAGGAVVNNGTWTMTGSNALTTTAGGSFTNNGILTLRGYSLAGTLTNSGTINWTAGVINGSGGNIQNISGAVFNIQFVSVNQLQVPFVNQAGATVNQNGTGTFNIWAGTNFTNAGTLNLVSANWVTNGPFTNSGTIDIPAGRLLTFGSTTNLNAGTSFTGAGSITSGGATNQNFPWTNGALSLTLSGGTWTSTAGHPLSFDAGTAFNLSGGAWINNSGSTHVFQAGRTFNWTAGTLGGTSAYTIDAGLTVSLSTSGVKTLNSALTNNGTINWSGGVINGTGNIQNANGAVFNIQFVAANQLQVPFTNQFGGTLNQNGTGTFNVWSGTSFTNAGTINLISANWLTAGPFTNSGTIDIPAGRLLTFGSTANLNAGTTFTGNGAITSGGTSTQNFPWTNSTHSLTISGGSWTNSSGAILLFSPGSNLNWAGGSLNGSSGYTIAAGHSVTIGTNPHVLNSTLTNNGTIEWAAGTISGTGNIQNTSGAVFNIQFVSVNQLQVPFVNQAGATVNQNGTGTFNIWAGTNFTNAGTLNLVSANWVTNGPFTNSGIIDIPSGRLLTLGGTANLNAGTTFTGNGAITSGGTTTQNFPWTNSSHLLTVSGGTWNNASGSILSFGPGSTFNWTGGTLAGAAGFETFSGANTSTFSGTTKFLNTNLSLYGNTNWTAGVLNGSGLLGNGAGATMNISFSGTDQLGVGLVNFGVLNYTGTGSFNTTATYWNIGTLNINSGQWSFNGIATVQSGVLNIQSGTTLTFNAATAVSGPVNNSGTFAGTITSFTGPTFTNNGSVTLTNLPFAGTATQTLDGNGSINNLSLNNANGLTLGGTQTVTGTLTLTNGRITLGNNDLVLSNTALAALVGGNATNHIVTNGTGTFRRNLPVSGVNYPFPIGTEASYLPMTLSNTSGPQERFGARVQNDVHSDYSTPGTPAGNLVVNEHVERTWVISEQTEGGNQATVQLQWNGSDEGANFGRANCALHSYNGTDWVALALGAAGGSNPYTRSASNVAVFREFTVADGESTLPFVCNNGLTPGSLCNDNDVCTINDVVTAGCQCAGTFQDADGDGTCDLNDGCPNDPNKVLPGICGCGISDGDSDSDGTPDCNDACPLDPNKIIPGDCGCGVSDLDSDDDGTADCNDGCPNDPLKTSPGGCGCGTPDIDANNDGVCDGNSACTAFIAPHLSGIPDAGPAITIEPACPPSNVGFVLINICSDATGIYRLYNEVTDVVVDFGQMNGCGATGHGCPGGGLSCLWESWQLPAGPYSLRLYNDLSGSQPLACARIDFTVPGAGACCGGLGPVGTPCDDGNACTVNDTLSTNCLCVGVLLDSDSDGTCDADDACPMDPNKIAPGACGCGIPDVPQTYHADTDEDGFGDPNSTIAGYTCDQPTGYVLDNTDNCPTLPGRVGDSCNDGNAGTTGDVITAGCVCLGTPIGTCTNYTLELQSGGGMANAVTYEVLDETGVATVLSGNNPVPPDGVGTLNLCLSDGCYQLRITDSAGDGLLGYILRETGPNPRRVIDNAFNMNDGVSQISAGGGFCLPLGDDRLIWSSCDKLDWIDNKFIVASSNTAVSAQFGISNTTSGYEFWFFDPNGGFSFRRFRSHATSDGTGSGATRACHFKVNGWFNTPSTPHLPDNVLLNVRIRGRVAGNNLPFGPACQFMLDAALAACPRVKLQDDPSNSGDYSCGVSRNFGGGSSPANRIHAAPPQPIPSVPSNLVRYQFRFRIPSEGICIVRPPQTSARMVMNWTNGAPLQCTKTYEVDVRVSLDGGASWCFGPAGSSAATTCADTEDWGKVCLVTINPCGGVSGGMNAMVGATDADPSDLLHDEQRVVLYPNPNHGDQLFLVMNDLEKEVHVVHLDILDLTGKRVMTRTIPVQAHGADAGGSVNTNLTLSEDLSSGVYIVHLSLGDRDHIERLVIQR